MSAFAHYPSLVDRNVVVTGGASGIGAAFVEQFARQGARVVFLDIDLDNAKALCADLSDCRFAPRFLPCDITNVDSLRDALAGAREQLGPITALVNNAANDARHDIETTSPDDFDWGLAVNLRHQYFAIQSVLPDMREAGEGSIICLGSTGWMRRNADYPLYATAKAGVHGLVNGLARKLGRDRIRINALVPGWVITEKQRRLWLDDAGKAELAREQCLPGYLSADDIARTALFLAADDSRMCTGQSFIVDGGWA